MVRSSCCFCMLPQVCCSPQCGQPWALVLRRDGDDGCCSHVTPGALFRLIPRTMALGWFTSRCCRVPSLSTLGQHAGTSRCIFRSHGGSSNRIWLVVSVENNQSIVNNLWYVAVGEVHGTLWKARCVAYPDTGGFTWWFKRSGWDIVSPVTRWLCFASCYSCMHFRRLLQ